MTPRSGPVSFLAFDLAPLQFLDALLRVSFDFSPVHPRPRVVVLLRGLDKLGPMLDLLSQLLLHVLLVLYHLLLPLIAFFLLFQVLLHSLHCVIEEVAASDFLPVSCVAVE